MWFRRRRQRQLWSTEEQRPRRSRKKLILILLAVIIGIILIIWYIVDVNQRTYINEVPRTSCTEGMYIDATTLTATNIVGTVRCNSTGAAVFVLTHRRDGLVESPQELPASTLFNGSQGLGTIDVNISRGLSDGDSLMLIAANPEAAAQLRQHPSGPFRLSSLSGTTSQVTYWAGLTPETSEASEPPD